MSMVLFVASLRVHSYCNNQFRTNASPYSTIALVSRARVSSSHRRGLHLVYSKSVGRQVLSSSQLTSEYD